jgi:phage terminase large subunit-like protein
MDHVPGALWGQDLIDEHRVTAHPDLIRVVIAVDPSGSGADGADEAGVVAVGRAVNGHCYVLKDLSCVTDPDVWAARTGAAYDLLNADCAVAEKNFGGEMVRSVLKHARPGMPIKLVTASRGKAIRAEPVAWLYRDGRVHHVGRYVELEDEQCTWTQDSGWSPGRMDALVWAVSDLMDLGQGSAWLDYLRQRKDEQDDQAG